MDFGDRADSHLALVARPLAGGGLVFNVKALVASLPLSGKKSLARTENQSRCRVAAVNHYDGTDGQLAFGIWLISTAL